MHALRYLALLFGDADPWRMLWHRVTPEQVIGARAVLVKNYSPATARRMFAALRGVLQEAWRLGLLDAEALARLSDVPPIRGRREPRGRALTEDELERLRIAADWPDRALLAALGQGGLRRDEAVRLRQQDVEGQGDVAKLRVYGKGNKERTVYVAGWAAHDVCLAALKRMGLPLFELASGAAVWRRVRSLARRAGVPPFSPHDLRRTFASRSLAAGVDLATVQAAMGHADPRTTARYDRRGDDALRAAAKRLA